MSNCNKDENSVQSSTTQDDENSSTDSEATATGEGTSLETTYLTLRRRKIYNRQETTLSEYLQNLTDKVKDSDKNTLHYINILDKKLRETRKSRLDSVEKFRKDTDQFREVLKDFQKPFHSIIKENSAENNKEIGKEVINSESSICNNSNSLDIVNPTDFVLTWLENSAEKSSNSLSLSSDSGSTIIKMVDYGKVAKLTSQMVPLFSGENHPNLVNELQTFLGCCNQVLKCLEAAEQSAFLEIFKTRLRGEAYRLVSSTQITNFKDVEELLNRTFLPRETYQEIVNKLITCQQIPLEPFSQFANRVKYLLTLSKEAADLKYTTTSQQVKAQLIDLAISTLKSGTINLQLKQYLLGIEENDIERLIQKALDMERLLVGTPCYQEYNLQNSQNQIQPYLTPNFSPHLNNIPSATNFTNSPNTISKNFKFSDTAIAKSSNNFNTSNFNQSSPHKLPLISKIVCSYCQKKGHTYDECLKRKNTPFCTKCNRHGHDIKDCRQNYSNNRFNNVSSQSKSPINVTRINQMQAKCDFCGRWGHTVTNCFQKRKWESKNQGNDNGSIRKSPSRS